MHHINEKIKNATWQNLINITWTIDHLRSSFLDISSKIGDPLTDGVWELTRDVTMEKTLVITGIRTVENDILENL